MACPSGLVLIDKARHLAERNIVYKSHIEVRRDWREMKLSDGRTDQLSIMSELPHQAKHRSMIVYKFGDAASWIYGIRDNLIVSHIL